MSTKAYIKGTFVRIPLAGGLYGYGRLRQFPHVSFYDFHTSEPISDLDQIASKPILFTLAAHKSVLDTWEIIGQRPLEEGIARPFERFMQDLTNYSNCKIMDEAGHARVATPEECIGLERVAVWESNHIEDRLLDTFLGRANKWVESLQVKLPDQTSN